MEITVRKGQTVYAADGTHLGGVVQCDCRFIVVGRSRWASDHVLVPVEQIAASGSSAIVLRTLPDAVLVETAEPWAPPPDASGNANGVDIEPLRAGMAELDDERAGIPPAPWVGADEAAGRDALPEPPLPSPEDALELARARIARIDSEIDRCISGEIEDLELGSACALPGIDESSRATERREGADSSLHPRPPGGARDDGRFAPSSATPPARPPSRAAERAARSRRAFERTLRRAGFSRVEAKAIATGGLRTLVSLVERCRIAPPPELAGT